LKIIVRRGEVAKRLFGLQVEFHVAEIRREIKGIIGAALRDAVFLAFNFDFLFVGIFLPVVVHVPAERNQEFINELFADFRLLILGREVEIFLRVKILCQGLHRSKCFIEVGRHGSEFAREIWQRQSAFIGG
jgi:hypothetical protein